jgi:hypothetical protein
MEVHAEELFARLAPTLHTVSYYVKKAFHFQAKMIARSCHRAWPPENNWIGEHTTIVLRNRFLGRSEDLYLRPESYWTKVQLTDGDSFCDYSASRGQASAHHLYYELLIDAKGEIVSVVIQGIASRHTSDTCRTFRTKVIDNRPRWANEEQK